MLSPLGVQAIIDERNELRQRVREAAEHVKRLQVIRTLELDSQRAEVMLECFQDHISVLTECVCP